MGKRARVLAALLAAVAFGSVTRAQEANGDELSRQIESLRAELARVEKAGTPAEALEKLQARIEALEAEIERLRAGGRGAAEMKSWMGFAPAASKVYGAKDGIIVFGAYSEFLYQRYSEERQDGSRAGLPDQADALRQVLYIGYRFDDRFLFNSELEFEHGSTGEGGEVSVEMAYVEFAPRRALGARMGLMLVPMGFTNELHEPPIFRGARRPEVESAIIPTTWRELGFGLFGETGRVQWRAYYVTGLISTGFNSSGLRGGRQQAARAKAEDFAFVGRLDLNAAQGVRVGVSGYSGESGQGASVDGRKLGARITAVEAHAEFERAGWQFRALAAKSTVSDAALVNQQNDLSGSSSVGSGQNGWYVQATYAVTSFEKLGAWSLNPFVRYEQLDTQAGTPTGFAENPATNRNVLSLGVDVKPRFNIALKVEFQRHRNAARTGANQFNVGLGFLF